MKFSLSDDQLEWARSRVASGEFGSIDEYVAALVQQEKDEAEKLEWLRAAIEKGRKSGISERSLQDIFEDFKKRRDAA